MVDLAVMQKIENMSVHLWPQEHPDKPERNAHIEYLNNNS